MATLAERCRRLLARCVARARRHEPGEEDSIIVVPLESVIGHNGATIRGADPLEVVTPAQQWAYAAEFPLADVTQTLNGALVATVEGQLLEGSVGAVCLDGGGRLLAEAFFSNKAGQESLRIVLPKGDDLRSLVLRNVSSDAPSRIVIHRVTLGRACESKPKDHELIVNAESLRYFKQWSGVTPAGFWADWLGVRTRSDVWEFQPDFAAAYSVERFENPGIPADDDNILNWIPMLDAVVASGDTFVMVALGAGWGRWPASGAFAAMQTGRHYQLVAVEAEPTHYGWMVRHFEENGLDPERYTFIRAAIAAAEGECWFRVGNSAAWYGQSIASDAVDASTTSKTVMWSEVSVGEERFQRVRCVDLRSVARDLPIIDYLHMDIQGAEAEVLCAHPDILRNRVRMVNIGTHSPEIEDTLRKLYSGLGWRSVYDVPLKATLMVRLGDAEAKRIEFGDGVQVWINPMLFRSAAPEHSP